MQAIARLAQFSYNKVFTGMRCSKTGREPGAAVRTTWSKARGLFHSIVIVPGAVYSDKDARPAEGKTIYTVDTVRTKRQAGNNYGCISVDVQMIPPLHHFASARFLSCPLLPLYFFLPALGSHFWRDPIDRHEKYIEFVHGFLQTTPPCCSVVFPWLGGFIIGVVGVVWVWSKIIGVIYIIWWSRGRNLCVMFVAVCLHLVETVPALATPGIVSGNTVKIVEDNGRG